MNFTVEQTGEFLKNHDGYLILTHVRPDGDRSEEHTSELQSQN